MSRTTSGSYQLTVTRDGVRVHRFGFDNLHDANDAVAEALGRHPDCEVRLVRYDAVLLSVGRRPGQGEP